MTDVELKTRLEVMRIKAACIPIRDLFRELSPLMVPGTSISDIRRFCMQFLAGRGVNTALRGFHGYPEDFCISINNIAAHGVIKDGVLQNGDLVSVDITTEKDGWHGDAAWTYGIGVLSASSKRLLKAAWQATNAGIQALHAGGYLNTVGIAVEKVAKENGCRVLPNFVGHGIGRSIHEDPKVLHTAVSQLPIPVVPGLVLTVEPILTCGNGETTLYEDGWSQITRDGASTAQFEHTVAVFSDHVEVLTMEKDSFISLDFPPHV